MWASYIEDKTPSNDVLYLVTHLYRNQNENLYKNGVVKLLLFYIMLIGSDHLLNKQGLEYWHNLYFPKISTTTDPTKDACGLCVASELKVKEDALTGKHGILYNVAYRPFLLTVLALYAVYNFLMIGGFTV